MSTLAQPPTAWTTRRWLTTISLLLLLHVGLIFALAKRIPGHFQPAENKTTDFRLAAPDFSTSLLEKLPTADPTVFVLPSRHGFYGRSWLGVKPVEYEAPDWSEPPRWLALNAGKLGLAAADFEPASTLPPLQINEKLSPLETSDPYALVPPLQQSSLMQLEGGLALRKLREQPVLPSWTYSDPGVSTIYANKMTDRPRYDIIWSDMNREIAPYSWYRYDVARGANHFFNEQPTGSNEGFMDAHVEWVPFSAMKPRMTRGTWKFWW